MTEGKQALEQAYALDREGKEHAARTQYERAFALGIPVSERRDALLCYGSTLRATGHYKDADRVLSQGVSEYPEYVPLRIFHAIAQYNCGDAKSAVQQLLRVLLHVAGDEDLGGYRRALTGYVEDVDRTW